MPKLMTGAVILALAMGPTRAGAQEGAGGRSGSTTSPTAPDTVTAAADNRPTIPGSIFVGSLAWYPGALAGALVTGAYCEGCSSSARRTMQVGVFGAAGLVTGLTVGAIARTSPRCNRSQALRAGVLGGEIGSFAAAAMTGLLGNRPIHDAPAVTPIALPVITATVATLLTRRCR